MNMEQKMTPARLTEEEQPKRLTRVEQARLEALKSFGCEDFASVLQSAKKVSLRTKLNISKKDNKDENKDPVLKEATNTINRTSDKVEFGLTVHLQELFDTNQKVLNQAKNLDSPF